MLEVKPGSALKAREIEVDFFEEDVDAPERPRVRLLFEVRRALLA
ncbi:MULTISPECIES: hypothetical protein [Thermococcus]|nr:MULTISPECIES: hypothetical protein [Thermococcus]